MKTNKIPLWKIQMKNLMNYMLVSSLEKLNRNPFGKYYDSPYSSYDLFNNSLENIMLVKKIEKEIKQIKKECIKC